MGKNREIGKDNQLLWHLPEDLKHFKRLTLNHPIIMGRKTFESLPGVLPNRTHIVLTQNKKFSPQNSNVIMVHSINEALKEAQNLSTLVFVIGGGELYRQFLPIADQLELTQVEVALEADTFFPKIPIEEFQLSYKAWHPQDAKHPFAFELQQWVRKST